MASERTCVFGGVRSQFPDTHPQRNVHWLQAIELCQFGLQGAVALLRLAFQRIRQPLVVVIAHLPHVLPIEQPLIHRALRRILAESLLGFGRTSVDLLLEGVAPLCVEQCVHLSADLHCGSLPGGLLPVALGPLSLREKLDLVVRGDIAEERLQTVVVSLQDGVELVIVAFRASVGQAHEDRSYRVGDVQQHLLPTLHQDRCVGLVGIVAVETGRDPGLRTSRPELVARELFLHKPVVGLVGIQGIDHVVAISPGVGAGLI